jgi:diguanylate cyclase (GGDEF)-like protein
MKNIQIILNAILSKNIFEYILLDKSLDILSTSDGVDVYLDATPKAGEDILEYLPELVGSEESIREILVNPSYRFILESVSKNGYYVNISVEHYDEHTLLLLIHNITDITLSKQKLLQYSNESLLLNNTLQKILDNQNAYIFVTHNEEIAFANKQFMAYFKAETIEELRRLKLDFYKHLDPTLKSYDALFERVNSKEEYILVENDTFILQASLVESTHKLFTLTKITNLSNKLQYDALTKAHKKEYFNKQLEKLILLGEEGAVVVLDLDNFKQVNDKFGHQVGDEVLQEFSTLIKENVRGEDIFARWGGEEFLLLLKHTTLEHAVEKAKKLCTLISTHRFKSVGQVTASLGVAWTSENDTLHSVLLRADKALYEAKNGGKNRVVLKMLKKSKK